MRTSRSTVDCWLSNQFTVSNQALSHHDRWPREFLDHTGCWWLKRKHESLNTDIDLISSFNYKDAVYLNFVFITSIPYSSNKKKKKSQILMATIKNVYYRASLRNLSFLENSSIISETMEGLIQRFSISVTLFYRRESSTWCCKVENLHL